MTTPVKPPSATPILTPALLLTKPVLVRGIDPVTQQTYFVRIADDWCRMRYLAALRRPHTAAFGRTGGLDSVRIDCCERGKGALPLLDHFPFRLYAAFHRAGRQRTLDHHRSTLLLDARSLHRFRQFSRWVAHGGGGVHTAALERAFCTLMRAGVNHGE